MKSLSKKLIHHNSLGEFLREARHKHHKTQDEIAKRFNLTAQFISNIELSKCSPPPALLKKLVLFYKIKPNDIINIILYEKKKKLEKLLNS